MPWKDRLLPSDLSVTDSIGTPEDDERLDDGIGIDEAVSRTEELNAEQQAVETVQAQEGGSPDEQADALTAVEDVVEAVEELDLSRRHVLSELGQTQTAQRWYEVLMAPSRSPRKPPMAICARPVVSSFRSPAASKQCLVCVQTVGAG